MNKIILVAFGFIALALFPSCIDSENTPWDTSPKTPQLRKGSRAEKKARLEDALSQVVLIRMNSKGTLELQREILSKEEFSREIARLGQLNPGKPVLFYYNSDDTSSNTKTIAFVVKACKSAGLGKIYRELDEIFHP